MCYLPNSDSVTEHKCKCDTGVCITQPNKHSKQWMKVNDLQLSSIKYITIALLYIMEIYFASYLFNLIWHNSWIKLLSDFRNTAKFKHKLNLFFLFPWMLYKWIWTTAGVFTYTSWHIIMTSWYGDAFHINHLLWEDSTDHKGRVLYKTKGLMVQNFDIFFVAIMNKMLRILHDCSSASKAIIKYISK